MHPKRNGKQQAWYQIRDKMKIQYLDLFEVQFANFEYWRMKLIKSASPVQIGSSYYYTEDTAMVACLKNSSAILYTLKFNFKIILEYIL